MFTFVMVVISWPTKKLHWCHQEIVLFFFLWKVGVLVIEFHFSLKRCFVFVFFPFYFTFPESFPFFQRIKKRIFELFTQLMSISFFAFQISNRTFFGFLLKNFYDNNKRINFPCAATPMVTHNKNIKFYFEIIHNMDGNVYALLVCK